MIDEPISQNIDDYSINALAFECGGSIGIVHAYLTGQKGTHEDAKEALARLFYLNKELIARATPLPPAGWLIRYPDKAAPKGYWVAGTYTALANAEADLPRYIKQFAGAEIVPFTVMPLEAKV